MCTNLGQKKTIRKNMGARKLRKRTWQKPGFFFGAQKFPLAPTRKCAVH